MQPPSVHLVKVGGSLFDLPDLGQRLHAFCDRLGPGRVLLFPGGGRTADVVRELDRVHRLGEEASHWLALRALSLNAYMLAQILGYAVTTAPREWQGDRVVLDPYPWVVEDDSDPEHCPHRWEVTSDSLALRLGQVLRVEALHLLKSTALPEGETWRKAVERGLVDAHFPSLLESGPELTTKWVNLRVEGELTAFPS